MTPTPPDLERLAVLTSSRSGAIADTVYARNQFGPYTRARVTPTQPGTAGQTAAQNAFAYVSRRWSVDLTPDQREAWNAYARRRSLRPRSRRRRATSGRHTYLSRNVARRRHGRAIVDDPPANLATPTIGSTSLGWYVSGGLLRWRLYWSDPGPWATTPNAFLLVQLTPIRPPTVNYIRGPWYAVALIAPYLLPPAQLERGPLTAYADPRRVARSRAYMPDGRVSPWTYAPSYIDDRL